MTVFVDNSEREEIRRAARSFVREKMPTTHLRALRDAGGPLLSRDLWREAAELGWAGTLVADEHGGIELGLVDAGILLEECGRTLAPTPLLSTAVGGASMLSLGGHTAALAALAEGNELYSLAFEELQHFSPYHVATSVTRDSSGWTLSGTKTNVLDATDADALLVTARVSGATGDRDGLALFRIPVGSAGVTVQPLVRVDSRAAGGVVLAHVHVGEDQLIGQAGHGADILDPVLDRATAALAAEMLGSLSEVFAHTLAYLKERTQFGVPIGSFQALKHRAARMFCEVELTNSVVRAALHAIDSDADDAPTLVSAAKARASDAYVLIANEAVQMHGGIGATDELDIGFYLKRARVAAMTFGTAAYHRDRFGRLSGY